MQISELINLRQTLHAYPECSGDEENTATYILKFLKNLKPDELYDHLGGYGVLSCFGNSKDGTNILFRCELDALPIKEINDFEYVSKIEGVSHKCGHDGHMAILCGLAQWLSENRPLNGRVYLLFQPAEETGEGARAVLKEPLFADLYFDWAFAIHNLPAYPLHQIVINKGFFTAEVKSVAVYFEGKTAHAAEPENGINPSIAIARILHQAMELVNDDTSAVDFFLITPVYTHIGEKAYGVSAGSGEVHFTIRSWTPDVMETGLITLLNLIKRIAEKYQLKLHYEFTNEFAANYNDETAVNKVLKAAQNLDLEYQHRPYPLKWGEDFGLFTQKHKGALIGLGAGLDHPALHHPDYDFPDELLPTGIELFKQILRSELDFA